MRRHSAPHALLLALSIVAAAPSLHATWVTDGVGVCLVFNAQDTPVILPDGAGGAFIVWRDGRTANTDIYAQRLDANGNLLWPSDGMPVCAANNVQSYPSIVRDGSDGAIVAWADFRSNNVVDIYAQRIDASGYGQWTANGVPICTGKMGLTLGQTISDGAGGAIITWSDRRNGTSDIFAQRINGAGGVVWTANGVTVCDTSSSETYPALASDGAQGAIIVWQDNRSSFNHIYAQRVNAGGTIRWMNHGVTVCNAAQYQTGPQIIPDGSGGAIIAWSDYRNGVDYGVYAQRIDADGDFQWAFGGVAVSATTGNQQNCKVVPVGSGGAILAWIDYRDTDANIYAQRINGSGVPQWTANGVPVCTAGNNQIAVQLIADGSDGAVAAWDDARLGTSNYDIYAQRINGNGETRWTADGMVMCGALGNQATAALAGDGWGGAFVTWKDDRGANTDIYAQRVDAAGHTVIATLLRGHSAAPSGGNIEITWTLWEAEEEVAFFVSRAEEPSKDFSDIPSDAIEREGLSFSFVDRNCEPGVSYRYRVDVQEGGTRTALFEVGPLKTPSMPATLYQNIPNPFNPSTTIRYYLPARGTVEVEVYDVRGNLVRRLADGNREKGYHTISWDGRDGDGNPLSSGVYYCRLKAGKETLSRTMILLR